MPVEFTKPWDIEARTCTIERADKIVRTRFRVTPSNCLKCNKPITAFVGCYHCDNCVEVWINANKAKGTRKTFEHSIRAKENRNAYDMARAWRPMTTNIYLQGDVGTGKSFLTDCILHKCRKLELSTLSMTGLEFCKQYTGKYLKDGAFEYLQTVDVIAIDDVDKAPWFGTTLYELWHMLNIRRNLSKSTIFSTNFDEGTLLKYFQEFVPKNLTLPRAIMDRLRPVLNIKMIGESLRKDEQTFQQANQQEELEFPE